MKYMPLNTKHAIKAPFNFKENADEVNVIVVLSKNAVVIPDVVVVAIPN